MVEVMVTLLIILVGLLGIAGLQMRAQISEMEAYQRAQALIFMSDIVDRINVNRSTVNCFQITSNTTNGTPYIGTAGTGHFGTPACIASTSAYNTQADATLILLNNQLTGTAETLAGADITNVGAMTGARACISYDNTDLINSVAGTGPYTVIITWQGMTNLIAPTNMNCAVGEYGDETRRRAVSTTLRLGSLL